MDSFWADRIAYAKTRPPFAVIDGVAVYGDGWAPSIGWGFFGDVAIAHPDYIAIECARNLAAAYHPHRSNEP